MSSFIREFGRSTIASFKNTFNFAGKSGKREFWFFLLFFFVAYVIVWVLDEVFIGSTVNIKDFPMGHLIPAGYFDPQVGLAVLLFRPIMAVPALSATVRRLHDIGKSGWWSVLWVLPVPLLGWFWLVPWLLRPSK